jgi:hypothetical protein
VDVKVSSGTWWAVHEHALRGLDAECLELVRLLDGEHDSFDELLNLLVESTDVRVRLRRAFVNLHRLDTGVELGGERVED